ncbi:MAG: Fic/DOC family protein [Candidatus Acididesulfobacter diazotrophicus]|uniref:Fic/DOC family protein n=1 Tax=Candidatus Acididesulfobacter diazotrophicus TaxID=2597226 RepID=A0A519BJP8_9DELT|nr:MAG: Fic/DOC family protein [Candidatus Acididesulfobacter diazotrophicus]
MENKLQQNEIKNEIAIYQSESGAIELRGDWQNETIWATQAQIANLFEVDRTVVTKHIKNIIKFDEVDEKSNVQKMHIPNSDKPVTFYSLDIILAVGYRVNSKTAVKFRRWATEVLKEHIFKGFSINKERIAANYKSFLKAIEDVKALLPESNKTDTVNILELVSIFADTWFSLNAYDAEELPKTGITKNQIEITANELKNALQELKKELIIKNEATDLFSAERQKNNIDSIVGNVFQSFGGEYVYPTVEEKAANLLYFFIKNHPFIDGNKRSGAFVFIWFLQKAGLLNIERLNPNVLTALTLLIAESSPKDKDKMTGIILLFLRGKIEK